MQACRCSGHVCLTHACWLTCQAVVQETAINIAFATSLLRADMTQYIVNVDSPDVAALEDAGKKEVDQRVCDC